MCGGVCALRTEAARIGNPWLHLQGFRFNRALNARRRLQMGCMQTSYIIELEMLPLQMQISKKPSTGVWHSDNLYFSALSHIIELHGV